MRRIKTFLNSRLERRGITRATTITQIVHKDEGKHEQEEKAMYENFKKLEAKEKLGLKRIKSNYSYAMIDNPLFVNVEKIHKRVVKFEYRQMQRASFIKTEASMKSEQDL